MVEVQRDADLVLLWNELGCKRIQNPTSVSGLFKIEVSGSKKLHRNILLKGPHVNETSQLYVTVTQIQKPFMERGKSALMHGSNYAEVEAFFFFFLE